MNLLCCVPLLVGVLTIFTQLSTLNALDKDMPSIDTPAYTAKFQVVIRDTGKSYVTYATENYDSTQKKSSLSLLKGGFWMTVMMDYNDQTLRVYNTSADGKIAYDCAMMSMKTAIKDKSLNDNFHFFGGFSSKTSNGPRMFSSKDMFQLNATFTYANTEDIDGITADKWVHENMNWADDKATFKITYYFTADEWTHDGQSNRKVPLRIKIEGSQTLPSGAKKTLLHFYEYVDFEYKKSLLDDAFDIPPGIHCISAVPVKKQIPSIATEATYDFETISSTKKDVRVETVAYSKKLGILSRDSPGVQVLYDFNHGVRYSFDRTDYFDCTIRAIDPKLDDNAVDSGFYVKDNGPYELSSTNHHFTYDGMGHSRRIATTNFGGDLDSKPFSVQFAAPDWKFSPSSSQRPVGIQMNDTQYNFYNFKPSYDERSSSLAQTCTYTDFRSVYITFVLNPSYYYGDGSIFTSPDVKTKMIFAIAKVSGLKVSQIEIQPYQTHFYSDTNTLQIKAFLIGQPDAVYKFRQVKNYAVPGSVNSQSSNIKADDDAAASREAASQCELKYSAGSFKCRNFDVCKNSAGSYSIKYYEAFTKGLKMIQSSNCNHFPRSVDTTPSVPTKEAFSNLKLDILKKGQLTVKMSIKENYYSTDYTLTASNIQDTSESYLKQEYDDHHPLSNFQYTWDYIPAKKTLLKSVKSLSGCAQACFDMGWTECQQMQYCYSSNKCYFSTGMANKTSTGQPNNCAAYTRLYITEFQKVAGAVMPFTGNKGQKVIRKVTSADNCASLCVQTRPTQCESFDYCSDTKECLLSFTHMYDATADKIQNTTICNHYSRNYIFDFQMARKTKLTNDPSFKVLTASTPEQCAYICEKGRGGGCVEFDYCTDTQVCRLVTGAGHSSHAHVASATCDTYTHKDNIFNKPTASAQISSSQSSSNTYSNAQYAGLAVGMIVVGLLIGAALFYVLYTKKILNRVVE